MAATVNAVGRRAYSANVTESRTTISINVSNVRLISGYVDLYTRVTPPHRASRRQAAGVNSSACVIFVPSVACELTSIMTDNDHGRAADVLFRRATEAFLAEVFADAKRLGGEPIHAETFKEASR